MTKKNKRFDNVEMFKNNLDKIKSKKFTLLMRDSDKRFIERQMEFEKAKPIWRMGSDKPANKGLEVN